MLSRFNSLMISMTATMFLVLALVVTNNSQADVYVPENTFTAYSETKLPELAYYDKYDELRANGNIAVIYPIFTQSAYDWGGFHDYYQGRCDACTNTRLANTYEKMFAASGNGFRILEFLGYQVIDDTDVDKNPEILNNYDKIIVLHNEFVTKAEFDAITHHSNVIYLYPGALTSEVTVNYDKNSISLIHEESKSARKYTKTGFNWKLDNSQYFNDWDCNTWQFYKVENGYMLDCYPETFLPNNGYKILEAIRNL